MRYVDPDGRDIVYKDNDGNEVLRESNAKNEIHTPTSDLEMMNNNANEMQNNKLNILFFARNVKTGGKWDFKDKNNPEHRSFYWFNDELVTAEEFGNIHYGYVGAAGGFGLKLLKDAPGIVQVRQKTAKFSFIHTNFDDPRDTVNITKGFAAYEKSFCNRLLNWGADLIYEKSGLQGIFRYSTGVYFLSHSIFRRKK